MSSSDSQEQFVENFDLDSASIDEFIRQLEEKEKDLHISPVDTVVEIEEYDSDSDSIQTPSLKEILENGNGQKPPLANQQIFQKELEQARKDLAEFRLQVRQLEKEREEMREVLSRRQNDFENYRKRIEREKMETLRGLVSDLASKMLPVVDNLSRAIDSVTENQTEKLPDFQHFLDGIVLVTRQLNEVLAEMGVEPIISIGETFDPHLHEAVATEKNETVATNTVTAEFLRGYRMGEKVIRHAMVRVSTGGSQDLQIKTESEEVLSDIEIENI